MSASFDSKTIRYSLGYSDEYMTVYNAMATKPSSVNAGYQNTMVSSLVSGGYWARMDYLLICATEINTGGEALINWINPGTLNADNVHSTAWTTLVGYGPGDDANDYISTNFVPSTHGSHYTQDSGAVGIYTMVNEQQLDAYVFGTYTTDKSTYLLVRGTADLAQFNINSGGGDSAANTVANGLFILSRTASNRFDLYRNGVRLGYDIDASGGLATNEFYLLNRAGSAGFSTNTVAIFFIMDGVSITEAEALNTIFETYMDAIGTGVQ